MVVMGKATWLSWKREHHGCHRKRNIKVVMRKGTSWLSWKKECHGCHSKRNIMDVIAKGMPRLS